MMDSKNLEVERAVMELINLVQAYQLDDVEPDPDFTNQAKKLRDHYNRLMYLAILNTTKRSFSALKKRLQSSPTVKEKPFFNVNVELAPPQVNCLGYGV